MKRKYSKRFHVDQSQAGKKRRSAIDLKTDEMIIFDSQTEKNYYSSVIVPKYQSGEIVDYQLQKKYLLLPSFKHNGQTIRSVSYIADFWIKYADGHQELKDVKGAGTLIDNVAKLKRKLFYFKYPDQNYEWVCWDTSKKAWVNYDQFIKERKEKKK